MPKRAAALTAKGRKKVPVSRVSRVNQAMSVVRKWIAMSACATPDNAATSATSWTVHTSATTTSTLRVVERDLSWACGGEVRVWDIRGLPGVSGDPDNGSGPGGVGDVQCESTDR
ncbi:hypothetical protein BX281_2363 [Streptomyces sp. Ag82_O1-15]|uniref:hypothetical protein n=1 Tax=Streptomyces sp. Ag82_O1-15 TaxID=1938855 RepID=UPI000BDAF078|nr:hypothetical protein [Streptomyces sp. Ag82_O1-15]PBC94453.1 hypothetical protein BX281_2363 [Streptomyces sp. Ag82_O1-15]